LDANGEPVKEKVEGYTFGLRQRRGQRKTKGLGISTTKKKGSREWKQCEQTALAICKEYNEREVNAFNRGGGQAIHKITLVEWMQSYTTNYKKADKRKVNALLSRVEKYFRANELLSHLSLERCQGFADQLQDELLPETARNYFQRFKHAITIARQRNYLVHNPIEGVKIKKGNRYSRIQKEPLTRDEIRLLEQVECGNKTVGRAFLFACFTGLGNKECRTLRWQNIQEQNGEKVLRYKRAKTDQPLNIYLSHALTYLEPNNSDYVFPELPSDAAINKGLRNWTKRAGIQKHVSFYCGRHTFASLQAANGASAFAIKANMGHANLTYTQRYVSEQEELQRQAVKSID
jgi:integrase